MSSDGGYDHAMLTRINKAWKKLIVLKSFLCGKRIGLNSKIGKICEAYVGSCMIYAVETWAMSMENMSI